MTEVCSCFTAFAWLYDGGIAFVVIMGNVLRSKNFLNYNTPPIYRRTSQSRKLSFLVRPTPFLSTYARTRMDSEPLDFWRKTCQRMNERKIDPIMFE